MSVDFRRNSLLHKQALVLADKPGVSDAGQLVFLEVQGNADRVHRMSLRSLRRFSIDRESKVLRLMWLSAGVLLFALIAVACLAIDEPGVGVVLASIFGSTALLPLYALIRAVVEVHVSLTFEDATRTRSFKTWTTRGRLRRFSRRLQDAVSVAQAP